jgi:uncharacterized protein (DUF2062 family)
MPAMNRSEPVKQLLLARRSVHEGRFGSHLKWLRDKNVWLDAAPQANPFAEAEGEAKARKQEECCS